MADLATAYVRIVPSLKGSQKALQDELGGIDTKPSGNKMGKGLGDGMKSGLSTAKVAIGNIIADIAMSAATAAASAIKNVIAGAFDNYADYEQLVGGVEKLYGDSSKKMLDYANQAYKTMGLSKNDYMSQVTSFSAALISDLGGDTAKAADAANVAMTSIADNVSIFGSNVEDVQNAYQGFAKQNYTMLDNLKLGYGGTQAEMQRLIADAASYTDIQEKLNLKVDEGSMSFSNIVNAIQVVQEKQGIAGNAAAETLKTISGSIDATKAAYDNLLTTLGDPNGDISAAVTNLVDMVSNSARLIIPKITEIMSNLAIAIPQLVDEMLPVLEEHATELIDSLSEVISALVPVLLEAAVILFAALLTALVKAMPKLLENMGKLVMELISAIANGIAPAMNEMNNFMQGILDSIFGFFGSLWNAGAQLVEEIVSGMQHDGYAMASFFVGVLNDCISSIGSFFESFVSAGRDLIIGLANGIAKNFSAVIDVVFGGLNNVINAAKRFLGIASPSKLFEGIGEYTMQGFANGIESASGEARKSMQGAMQDVYGLAGGTATMAVDASVTSSGSMAAEVASLREELRQMRLVLAIDGRTFAEATVDEIDRAMGTRSRRAMAR